MTPRRSPKLPAIPEPADILTRGAASVLADVRRGLSTLATEHRKSLYQEVSRAYAVGLVLKADRDEWLKFCLHSDWATFRNKPKDTDRSDALRFALRFAVGFANDPVAKKAKNRRVDRLYGALKSLFAEGVSPAEIPNRIRENGGLEALKSANAAASRTTEDNAPKPAFVAFRVPLEGTHRLFLSREVPFKMTVKLNVKKVVGNRLDAQLLGWTATRKSTDFIPISPCNTSVAPPTPVSQSRPVTDTQRTKHKKG